MGHIEGPEHRPRSWPIEEQSLISWWSYHQWRVSGRAVTWRGSWSPHCWPCSAGSSHDQKGQNGQKSGEQNPASVSIWRLVCQTLFKKLSSVSPEWKFHHFLSWVFLPSTARAINLGCLLQKPINYQKLDKSEENYSKHSVWPLNQSSIHWDWLEIGVSKGRSCTGHLPARWTTDLQTSSKWLLCPLGHKRDLLGSKSEQFLERCTVVGLEVGCRGGECAWSIN